MKTVQQIEGTLADGNNSIIMFNPMKRNMYTNDGNLVEGHRLIGYDKDEQFNQLGIVGKNYKPFNNKEVYQAITDFFYKRFAPYCDYVKINDTIVNSLTIRDISFYHNKHNNIGFRIIIINSFDGSSSLKILFGAIDFFCLNGMVLGSYDNIIKRHSSTLDMDVIAPSIENSVNKHDNINILIDYWKDTSVEYIDVLDFNDREIPYMSKHKKEMFSHQLLHEFNNKGKNIWSVVSALSFQATHANRRSKYDNNIAKAIIGDQQTVSKIINSKPFMDTFKTKSINEILDIAA